MAPTWAGPGLFITEAENDVVILKDDESCKPYLITDIRPAKLFD